MELLVNGLVFFAVVFGLWYIMKIKNFMGMGVRSKKEAFTSSLLFAVIATAIYTALNFFYIN